MLLVDLRVLSVHDHDNLSHRGILRGRESFAVGQIAPAQCQTLSAHRELKKMEVASRDYMLLLGCRGRPEWAEGLFLEGECMSIVLLKSYNSTNDLG